MLNAIQQKLRLKVFAEFVLMSMHLNAGLVDVIKVDMNWLRRFLDVSNGYALVLINETVILNCNRSAKSFVISIIERYTAIR